MATDNYVRITITRGLATFRPTITVPHYNAQRIFDEVLSENPELLFYIQSFSSSVRTSLLGAETEFKIAYTNTDVSPGSIVKAESTDEVENALHRCIGKYLGRLVLCVPSSLNIDSVYNNFMVSYEGFYSNLLSISSQIKTFSRYSYVFVTFAFKYRIGRVQLNFMLKDVDKEVRRLSALLFLPEMSPEMKAYVAHNYLARTVEYFNKDDANPLERSYMQSAYGALINHRCVCQGYAEAYKRLMNSEGIECEVICGKVRGSAEHHAWNVISFDGRNYYHVDVTWDSLGGGVARWDHFCKNDDHFRSSRIWTRLPGIVCSDRTDVLSMVRREATIKRTLFASKGIDTKYL